MTTAHWRALLPLFLAMLLLAPGAGAAKQKKPAAAPPLLRWEQPMKVAIVRGSDKACEPTCPEWIMAEGMIDAKTPALIQSAVVKARARSGGAGPVVILHSNGGNILAALQIGYFLRAQNVATAVGKTKYKDCDPFDATCTPGGGEGIYLGKLISGPASCLSACPLILAGGIKRLAGSESYVGVHRWSTEADPGKRPGAIYKVPKSDTSWDKVVRKMMSDYLVSMDISLDVVADMNKTPFASMKYYDLRQRVKLKLVTGSAAARSLTSPKICSADKPAPHCVRRN